MAHSVDIVIRARDEASAKFGHIGKAAGGMGSMIRQAAMAVGAYISVREIVSFASSSVKAFAESEMAVKHLSDALTNLGLDSKSAMMGMQEFARQIMQATVIDDEATLEMMALGASMGKLSGQTLKAATAAAIGLSKAYKIDLETAMRLVSKAATGNTTTLAKYGIKLDESMTAQEKFNEVLKIGIDNFTLAQGEIETTAGKAAQLSNAWGELKESIGKAIVTSSAFPEKIAVAQIVIENFGLVMDAVWTSAGLSMVEWFEDFKYFFSTAVPICLTYFRQNWKDILKDVGLSYAVYLTQINYNTISFFKALVKWIKGEEGDFKWVTFINGFESSLGEMPEIAKRELSELEKELQKELDKISLTLYGKYFEKKGGKILGKDFLKGAVMPDIEEEEKPEKKGKDAREKVEREKMEKKSKEGELNAFEARFLTFAPGRKFDDSQNKTAANTAKMINILHSIERKLEKQNEFRRMESVVLPIKTAFM